MNGVYTILYRVSKKWSPLFEASHAWCVNLSLYLAETWEIILVPNLTQFASLATIKRAKTYGWTKAIGHITHIYHEFSWNTNDRPFEVFFFFSPPLLQFPFFSHSFSIFPFFLASLFPFLPFFSSPFSIPLASLFPFLLFFPLTFLYPPFPSGVARAFPGGRLAHPENHNEEKNK